MRNNKRQWVQGFPLWPWSKIHDSSMTFFLSYMRALSFIPSWFVNAAPQLNRKCSKLRATFHTFSKLAGNHLMLSNNVRNIFWYFLSELDLDVRLFWISTSTPRCLLQETLRPALQSRRAWPALEETAQPGVRRDNPHTHTLSKFTTVCHSELEP